jgi:hypothetical protein
MRGRNINCDTVCIQVSSNYLNGRTSRQGYDLLSGIFDDEFMECKPTDFTV